jgi:ribosomal-protein-alanine N-acetyltransferase
MERSDLAEIIKIEAKVYPFPWSQQIFIDSMDASALLVVLEMHQQIVGYAVLSHGVGESEILNIVVTPEAQGKGYGDILLHWVIEQARKVNSETIFLEVRASNLVAQNLYQKVGFNEIGERRGYYRVKGGAREDALVFALQLFF